MTDYLNHPENPGGSNLVAHTLRELDRIGETSLEAPSMRACVVEIVRLFSEQGHSGSSASWLSAVLDKVMRFQPLSAITSAPDDWMEVTDNLWQCVRDSECFSRDGGKTYTRNSDPGTIHQAVAA